MSRLEFWEALARIADIYSPMPYYSVPTSNDDLDNLEFTMSPINQ